VSIPSKSDVDAPEAVTADDGKSFMIHNPRACRSNQTLFGYTIRTDATLQAAHERSAHRFIS